MIVTALKPGPCPTPRGDFINLLSVKNKQDYARQHGYDFYLATHQSSPDLRGAWNKVALVRELWAKTRDYDWIMWIDYDALIMDMSFALPLERYHGKDLVLWGQERELFEIGDAHMGRCIGGGASGVGQ